MIADRAPGVGVGYRRALTQFISSNRDQIDCLEIVVEQFLDQQSWEAELEQVLSFGPVIPHGLNMSIGSCAPLPDTYVEQVRDLCRFVDAAYYSDHLCITRMPGIDIGHLTPLWYTWEQLDRVARNVELLQDRLQLPLALENITAGFLLPGDLEEPEFFAELTKRTGCFALLDLNNIVVNAANLGHCAHHYLARFPLSSVIQVHLAGSRADGGITFDSHDRDVSDDVWELLEHIAPKISPSAIIIERDAGFEEIEGLLPDILRAKAIMASRSG